MSLKDRAHRSAACVEAAGGTTFEVTGLEQIEAALDAVLDQPPHRLVIAGGDGTLQAAVNHLARRLAPDALPELIVLSAGRTNYVASDVGTGSRLLSTLEAVLQAAPGTLYPEQRGTLRLEHPSVGTLHGFFLAGAMLDQMIRGVHRWRGEKPGWARRRHLASTFGVIRLLPSLLRGSDPFHAPDLSIDAGALGRLDGRCRYLMLTTLAHARGAVRPYAERGDGPLRVTAIRLGARALGRRFAGLVGGRFNPSMNPDSGYLSGNCDSIEIRNLDSIVLDGQPFQLDPGHPLRVAAGPRFRFLRP